MGIDAIIKRYFPAVVCALIAMAAYFQAAGMTQLVASSVALDPSAVASAPPPPKARPVVPHGSQDHATSASLILSRNPFDSVTGPLDGQPLEPVLPEVPEPPANTNPLEDPVCEVARVLLITASDDPDWSFAVVAGSDGKSMLRRVGDEIAGHQVHYIGWDRVWLTQGTSRCQMVVGGKAEVKAAPPPKPAAASEGESPKPSRRSRKVPPEIAAKIHKVSETEFNVERSVVDQILENQAELMRSARIVPEKDGDKVVGIRLFGIRQDSLLGTLGLENGDRLSTINGFEVSDPQKALEAYARLRTADRLSVTINRRGKPMSIDYHIK